MNRPLGILIVLLALTFSVRAQNTDDLRHGNQAPDLWNRRMRRAICTRASTGGRNAIAPACHHQKWLKWPWPITSATSQTAGSTAWPLTFRKPLSVDLYAALCGAAQCLVHTSLLA